MNEHDSQEIGREYRLAAQVSGREFIPIHLETDASPSLTAELIHELTALSKDERGFVSLDEVLTTLTIKETEPKTVRRCPCGRR